MQTYCPTAVTWRRVSDGLGSDWVAVDSGARLGPARKSRPAVSEQLSSSEWRRAARAAGSVRPCDYALRCDFDCDGLDLTGHPLSPLT